MQIHTIEEGWRALQDGPADAEEDVEGRRREARGFFGGAGGGGATDVALGGGAA